MDASLHLLKTESPVRAQAALVVEERVGGQLPMPLLSCPCLGSRHEATTHAPAATIPVHKPTLHVGCGTSAALRIFAHGEFQQAREAASRARADEDSGEGRPPRASPGKEGINVSNVLGLLMVWVEPAEES
jgi:hypothetical protein